MRPQITQILLALCSLFLLAHAFTREDHEIFRLRDELEATEGTGVTFYDFVGASPGATGKEIYEAFRKKSKAIHPDKVRHKFVTSKSIPKAKKPGEKRKPGVHASKGPSQREIEHVVKQATERYQRLSVVAKLLQKSSERQRYDHFLRYGFPAWRGTGYYYSRYRPGFGTVLVGLFLVGGGLAHYGVLRINYNRQRAFMEKYIKQARKTAWGDESGVQAIPGVSGPVDVAPPPPEEPDPMANMNRRQKRELEKQNKKDKSKTSTAVKGSSGRVLGTGENVAPTSPTGARRRVTAENGKVLIVDSVGNVFLEEEDEEGNVNEFLLDLSEIKEPSFRDTAVVTLPIWLYRKALGRVSKSRAATPEVTESPADESDVEDQKLEVPRESSMTSSQMLVEEYEMVDSTGIEKDAAAGNNGARKRGKKNKK